MQAINRSFLLVSFFSAILLFGCQKDTPVDNDTDIDPKPPVAQAGNAQTIQLPVNTVSLSGSGTTTNGYLTAYLWSLVSGPNIPDIASPGSAATVVSGLIVGTYHFQLMVVDSAGLTGVDSTSVTVNPPSQQTITLQTSTSVRDELNIVLIGAADGSTHQKDLDAAAWTINAEPTFIRGAFKFDLSGIPANATILSAKLTLYSIPDPVNGDLVHANAGTNNSMFLQRITTDWAGDTTKWQTQPLTTTTDQVSIPHTSQAFLDLVDLDVKNMVSAMHTGDNYGFMFRLQNEVAYTSRQFCSPFYPDATKHPKLVVVYQ